MSVDMMPQIPHTRDPQHKGYELDWQIDSLAQDCGNSSALMKLPQSCAKPWIWYFGKEAKN